MTLAQLLIEVYIFQSFFYLATSQWSSWSSYTQCQPSGNGFQRFSRKCIKGDGNDACVGLDTKATPCHDLLQQTSTHQIDGSFKLVDIKLNSLENYVSFNQWKYNYYPLEYEAFKFVVQEALVWLFHQKNIHIQNLTLNYNIRVHWETVTVFVTYSGIVSSLVFDFDALAPLNKDVRFKLRKENSVVAFKLSPIRSNISGK